MIETLLSIGAINALIPIIVILILIAAAASSTRGSKLFELFGISTLLGVKAGKGTLSGKSPFKAKGFKFGKNPFQKMSATATGLAADKASATYNKALMTRAHNVSFDNLGRGGPSASGTTPGTISDFAYKQHAGAEKSFGDRGLSSTLDLSAKRVKMAIKGNFEKVDRKFERKKLGVLSSTTLTEAQKAERLNVLKSDYNDKMFKARANFSKEIGGLTKISKNPPISPKSSSLSDHLKMLKFQHLVDSQKAALLETSRISTQSTKDFSLLEKAKLKSQRLQWNKEKEMQKFKETNEEIAKMKEKAKGTALEDVFKKIESSSRSSIGSDARNIAANEVFGKDWNSEIMDTKKFLKSHKKFVL